MSASSIPRIYVASPLGFTASTRFYYGRVLLPALAGAGFEVADPWADFDPAAPLPHNGAELRRLYRSIGKNNVGLIEGSRGLLAVLEGADVDSGTAAEIGYAAAQGIPIVGYRDDVRQTGEQGALVNLQVEYFIRSTGGSMTTDLASAIELLKKLIEP